MSSLIALCCNPSDMADDGKGTSILECLAMGESMPTVDKSVDESVPTVDKSVGVGADVVDPTQTRPIVLKRPAASPQRAEPAKQHREDVAEDPAQLLVKREPVSPTRSAKPVVKPMDPEDVHCSIRGFGPRWHRHRTPL